MKLPAIIQTYILIAASLGSLAGSIIIMRADWKRYGLLFFVSGFVGLVLCLLFLGIGFYSFPHRLFPEISPIPFEVILTTFPFLVLFGVRYSPVAWKYKIPFYWAIVHLGMLGETLALQYSSLIRYDFKWDFWDSYTWWWVYLLLFDWVGGIIIPPHLRKPIDSENFRYGRGIWTIFHFIVIITIFLAGYYLGKVDT